MSSAAHRKTEAAAEAVYRRFLRRAMAALQGTDAELDAVFERAARALRRKLRAIHLTDREVEAALVEVFAETLGPDRRKAIESAIRSAAQRGVETDRATFDEVFGRLEGEVEPGSPFAGTSRSRPGETRSE